MSTEPLVKICGITRREDAALAWSAGAWAVGVVLSPGGPRSLERERAAEVLGGLPEGARRVGVFVDPAAEEVSLAVAELGLSHVQVHAAATPRRIAELAAAAGVPVIEAVSVAGEASLTRAEASPADLVLLDAAGPGGRGGTGRRIDWALVARHRPARRFGLAGGLTPANVVEALSLVRPALVDVSSGVEAAPGVKDHALVDAFIRAASSVGTPA